MQPPDQDRSWIWITRGALLLYGVFALFLILQRPGLYYDEALMVVDAVHMRHSPAELALAHDPQTWICLRGRCLPLMTMSYIGAVKEYVCLPLFALFSPRSEIVRLVSVLFSLFCIGGVGRLIGEQGSHGAGAAAAMAIALNPAFVNMTVFDNGAVAVWMLAFGLLCVALARYVRAPGTGSAFWMGAAMGLGVWARANFAWLLIAILAATFLVLRKQFRAPVAHWTAWIAGGILGGLPFLAYQVYSKGGTWKATAQVLDSRTFAGRLSGRFFLFAETLLTDLEHRAMWDGPWTPDWQHWLFPAIVLAGSLVCLTMSRSLGAGRARWARGITLAFLVLALFYFLTGLRVAEHHLITLVPLAVMVTVLACVILQARFQWGWVVSTAIALVYLGCALYWQGAAIRGLHRTRGVGAWSDGIYALARQFPQKYPSQTIQVLDWGLGFNLYVLSDAKVHIREILGDTAHKPWLEEIRRGGVFLLNGPQHRQLAENSLAFLEALEGAHARLERYTVPQHDGVPFAEVIEIEPNSISGTNRTSLTGESRSPKQLDGIYPPEPAGWRWTKREFSATFGGVGAARLIVQLFVADASIQKLGAITLTARLGEHVLASETYRQPGQYTLRRDLEEGWMKAGANRFEFSLDKALSPQQADGRELGIVVSGIALEPK